MENASVIFLFLRNVGRGNIAPPAPSGYGMCQIINSRNRCCSHSRHCSHNHCCSHSRPSFRRHSSSTGSGSGRSYCTRFLRFHTRIHNHNRSLLPLHHSLLVPPSSMFDYTASYDPQLARVSMFCKNFRKFFLVRAVFCSIIGAFSGSL